MLGSHDEELMCVTVRKSDKRDNAGHVTDKSHPASPRPHDDARNVQYYLNLPHSCVLCDTTLDYHEHRGISSLWPFPTCVSFFYPFIGTRMKTVLCWKPVFVTMWPSWCVSTLRGTDDPATTQCACDHLLQGEPRSDTAALLHAGRRRSTARNILKTCRPRSTNPPWSVLTLVDFFVAATWRAASRSDWHTAAWSKANFYLLCHI